MLFRSPAIRVLAKPIDLLYDTRLRGWGKPAQCSIRANSSFIAPINPDSMDEALNASFARGRPAKRDVPGGP